MNHLVTSLIGRQAKNQHSSAGKSGTIVAVYIVHDEPILVVENCEGGLYTMNAVGARLVPETVTVSGVIGTDLHPFKEPNNPIGA